MRRVDWANGAAGLGGGTEAAFVGLATRRVGDDDILNQTGGVLILFKQ